MSRSNLVYGLGLLCLPLLLSLSCGSDSEELPPNITCEPNVWIQATSDYEHPLTIAVTTLAPICNEDNYKVSDARMEVTMHDVVFAYLPADVDAGHTIVYTVVSEGPLKDQTITCTADQIGIDLSYLRMQIDLAGNMSCSCGYTEFIEIYGPDACA